MAFCGIFCLYNFCARACDALTPVMFFTPNNRKLYLSGFLVCVGLIAFALFMQYGLGYDPCPLCIFQRIAFIFIGLICLLAAMHGPSHGASANKFYGSLIGLSALGGLGISLRHSWLQHFPPETVECGAGLDYWLQTLPVGEIIQKILTGSGECSDIVWKFLGLSIPEWTAIMYTCFFIFAIVLWRQRRR